jgi:simple sugar transport system permease protein
VGEVLFQHDPLVYGSFVAAAIMAFAMQRTRFGLWVRAVGEDPKAAYAQGVPVTAVRWWCVIIGGVLAGVGGAHLAIAYTHVWAEKMTAGQGWIAIGLVIVAGWSPARALFAAWLFGAAAVLHPHLQAVGIEVSPYLVAMLPYLLSIVALTLATAAHRRRGYGLPAALAKEFRSEEV